MLHRKITVYTGSLNSSRFSSTVNKFTTLNTIPLLFSHVRYFSFIPSQRIIKRSQSSFRDITSEEINKLLVKQGVSISEEELNKLKNISGVKFDLPINDQTSSAFVGLVGKPKGRG